MFHSYNSGFYYFYFKYSINLFTLLKNLLKSMSSFLRVDLTLKAMNISLSNQSGNRMLQIERHFSKSSHVTTPLLLMSYELIVFDKRLIYFLGTYLTISSVRALIGLIVY